VINSRSEISLIPLEFEIHSKFTTENKCYQIILSLANQNGEGRVVTPRIGGRDAEVGYYTVHSENILQVSHVNFILETKLNSLASVRERTVPTKRLPLVG
jgi:hypothetical protein